MTHFVVFVIGDNVDEQLAPYQENNTGDCPRQYLEFEDVTDKAMESWNTKTYRAVLVNGEYVNEKFAPEGSVVEDVSVQKFFENFDDFATQYYGTKDEKTGRYGYWHNPNSKWDYYEVGGRWDGFLTSKSGKEANSLTKGEIDLDGAREIAASDAGKLWDTFHKIVNGRSWKTYNEIRAEYPEKLSKSDIEEIRGKYIEQDVVKDLHQYHYVFMADTDEFLTTRDEFVAREKNNSLSPFAFVKDGKWYEKGKIGWWATVTDEVDRDEWNKQYQKMIDELPDDTLITVIDCHV